MTIFRAVTLIIYILNGLIKTRPKVCVLIWKNKKELIIAVDRLAQLIHIRVKTPNPLLFHCVICLLLLVLREKIVNVVLFIIIAIFRSDFLVFHLL